MTNTTETFWSADGVSLQTFARNISTLGGRLAPPPMRGSNTLVPYNPGQKWEAKIADSQELSLSMWVRGRNDDGSLSGRADDTFDDNWRTLRSLLWTPGRQFVLQKKFKVNGLLRSASALAEFSGGFEPTMIGRSAAKFTVDLTLADPYFYDDSLSTVTLVNGNQTIVGMGDAESTNVLLTINGSRDKITVINSSLAHQVQYYDALLSGGVARLDTKTFTAMTTPSGVPTYDSTGKVRHSGSPHWLKMRPGNNIINLSSQSGTGQVQLQTRWAWI